MTIHLMNTYGAPAMCQTLGRGKNLEKSQAFLEPPLSSGAREGVSTPNGRSMNECNRYHQSGQGYVKDQAGY